MKHYINLKISPEYALLISGKWGTGKTFFINNYLEKESHKEIKFIKISLFGIKSINEIHKQIIFQLIGTEEGSLANSLMQISTSILDALGKKINLGINDIPIEQVLKTLTKKLDKLENKELEKMHPDIKYYEEERKRLLHKKEQ